MGGKGNAYLYQTTILNFCLRVAEIRINAIAVHGLLRKVMDIGVILLSPENAAEHAGVQSNQGFGGLAVLDRRFGVGIRLGGGHGILRDVPNQFAAAVGAFHRFLAEQAAGALGVGGGAVHHDCRAVAVSRRVWLLMAAW